MERCADSVIQQTGTHNKCNCCQQQVQLLPTTNATKDPLGRYPAQQNVLGYSTPTHRNLQLV